MLLVRQLALFRQIPCRSKCHSAWYNSHLNQRISPTQHPRYRGMSRLMESNGTLLFFRHNLRLTLQTAYYAVNSIHEILLAYRLVVITRSYQGSLVAHIRYIGAGETRSLLGEELNIHSTVNLNRTQMNTENLLTLLQIRQIHMNLSIESACTQKRRV